MVRVSHQLHFWRSPSIAVFPNGLLFLHLNLNLETIMSFFENFHRLFVFYIKMCYWESLAISLVYVVTKRFPELRKKKTRQRGIS